MAERFFRYQLVRIIYKILGSFLNFRQHLKILNNNLNRSFYNRCDRSVVARNNNVALYSKRYFILEFQVIKKNPAGKISIRVEKTSDGKEYEPVIYLYGSDFKILL
jgi:hypothetical protein